MNKIICSAALAFLLASPVIAGEAPDSKKACEEMAVSENNKLTQNPFLYSDYLDLCGVEAMGMVSKQKVLSLEKIARDTMKARGQEYPGDN